jgi:outer membrane protein OmpA-like peptidoglycan-associated protein
MKHYNFLYTGLVLAAGGLVLTACGGPPPPNANLNQARAAYAAASNDPNVARAAPRELEDAQASLQAAQKSWEDGADKAQVDQEAYLAQRYSEIAAQQARRRAAAEQVANATRTISLGDMSFQTGKADLNAQGLQSVRQIATFMQSYPDRRVALTGYTDSTGSDKVNARLSEARANSVRAALINDGVDPSHISASGAGPSNPVASNSTANGRAQNRRVEASITGSPSSFGSTTGAGTTAPSH